MENSRIERKNIVNCVRQACKNLGMSQSRLAELIGIGQSTVSSIETGHCVPGVDVLFGLRMLSTVP